MTTPLNDAPRRVLILKFWAIGDILMATPMLSALRAARPDVHITWAVDRDNAEILRGHPDIDELWAIDTKAWRKPLRSGNLPGWVINTLPLRSKARVGQFDAVINCHPDKWWSATLCISPRRIGLYPSLRLPASRHLYTNPLNRPRGIHNTDHYLTATQALDCPDASRKLTLGETPDEQPFLETFFARHNLYQNRPILVLAPFSTGENRCWEPERYAAVSDRLSNTLGVQTIVTFAPKEEEQARHLCALMQTPPVLAIGTTLREYVALVRHADLLLGVDSSAMHLAASVDTAFLALFGPTPIRERAPLAGRGLPLAALEGLQCAPCDQSFCVHPTFRACMKQIEVDTVYQAAARFLQEPHRV